MTATEVVWKQTRKKETVKLYAYKSHIFLLNTTPEWIKKCMQELLHIKFITALYYFLETW